MQLWLASCAAPAFSNEISPPPPQKAPVRRSMTNGQLEKIIGKPGSNILTMTSAARVSAKDAASMPSMVAGEVAPDIAATMELIGIPRRMQAMATSKASSP
jgi:hypothetical protein